MISVYTTLSSKNYILRATDESDLDFTFSATQFPGFNDGMHWDAPKSKSELRPIFANYSKYWETDLAFSFTILSKANQYQRLGRISIRKTEEKNTWHVGFWTHPEHQGNGIMSEVLACILDFSFNRLYAEKIQTTYATWNKASERVLLKNGFKFVRTLEKVFKKNGKWVDEHEVAMEQGEWKK